MNSTHWNHDYINLVLRNWNTPREIAALNYLADFSMIKNLPTHLHRELHRGEKISILDAGCGAGRLCHHVPKDFGIIYYGLDSSPDLLRIAHKNYATPAAYLTDPSPGKVTRAHPKNHFRFTEGSVYQIPFAHNSFNLVISHAVLFHLCDIPRALAELWRVTRWRLVVSFYVRDNPILDRSPLIGAAFGKLGLSRHALNVVPVEDPVGGNVHFSVRNALPRWMIERLITRLPRLHTYTLEIKRSFFDIPLGTPYAFIRAEKKRY